MLKCQQESVCLSLRYHDSRAVGYDMVQEVYLGGDYRCKNEKKGDWDKKECVCRFSVISNKSWIQLDFWEAHYILEVSSGAGVTCSTAPAEVAPMLSSVVSTLETLAAILLVAQNCPLHKKMMQDAQNIVSAHCLLNPSTPLLRGTEASGSLFPNSGNSSTVAHPNWLSSWSSTTQGKDLLISCSSSKSLKIAGHWMTMIKCSSLSQSLLWLTRPWSLTYPWGMGYGKLGSWRGKGNEYWPENRQTHRQMLNLHELVVVNQHFFN